MVIAICLNPACLSAMKAAGLWRDLTILDCLDVARRARPLLERVGSGLRHLCILMGRDPGHADPTDDSTA